MTEDSMVQEVFEQLKKAEKQTHDNWIKVLADTMTTQFDWLWGSANINSNTLINKGKTLLAGFYWYA